MLPIVLAGCGTVSEPPLLIDASHADAGQNRADASTEAGDASEASDVLDASTSDANLCEQTGGTCVAGGTCALPSAFLYSCGQGGGTCCLCLADADVPLIVASNYDQSCTVDSDCIAVGVGNPCATACLSCLQNGAIGRSSLAQYRADLANSPAGKHGALCSCPIPTPDGACCRAGLCTVGASCSTPFIDP